MTNNNDQIQLYQKHIYPSGRVRYIPAEKIYDHEIIKPNIIYMVHSHAGSTSTRYIREEVTPDYYPILTALKLFEDEAINVLSEANKAKKPRALTPLEVKAVKAYCDIIGDDASVYFEGIAMTDFVRHLITFLEEKIKINDESNNYK